ncbi:hypothetical protein Y1Q_0004774 [Alligator mississippiensis]|uniref:IF rod domain-containing protein n=1 Tax=Alligator mississippiensis TaxID=8496 RepID=A0A151P8T3_ALLMI|nr:hypothetical protein Y1Q_0004774 [Alligator mississippiensis]
MRASSTSYRRAFGPPPALSSASYGSSSASSRFSAVRVLGTAPGRSGPGLGLGLGLGAASYRAAGRPGSRVTLGSAGLELSAAEALNQELLATRSNEKAELQELNDRFATFIEWVRSLEQHNAALAAELNRARARPPARAADLVHDELRELRRQLDLLGQDRDRLQLERDNLAEDLGALKQRLENETHKREEAENNLVLFRKVQG